MDYIDIIGPIQTIKSVIGVLLFPMVRFHCTPQSENAFKTLLDKTYHEFVRNGHLPHLVVNKTLLGNLYVTVSQLLIRA